MTDGDWVPDEGRKARLRRLGEIHAAWSQRWNDRVACPPEGRDTSVHHLDAAGDPEAEAEFQNEITNLFGT